MKKQYRAAVVSYCLAAAAVLGGFIYKNHLTAEYYRRQVTNSYRHAFNELVSEIGEVDSALQKCLYSGTPAMMSESCVEVFGASMSAKQALGELPNSDTEFEHTSGFLSRVGDYAFALSKKTASGEQPDGEAMENLRKLSDAASVLSGNMTGLLAEVNDGSLSLEEINRLGKRAARRGAEATGGVLSERVKVAEGEFPELPTLIYDGPFSSHINGMKPKLTEGKPELTREQAQKKAAQFAGSDGLEYDGERAGNLPVYLFSLPAPGGATNLEVTKAGGYIVNMYSSHIPGRASVSPADAVKTAEEFLTKKGFTDFRESYRMSQNDTVTVNFAYETGGVICYTDLIKVEVALDTGEVTGFEAQGYVMHHREREVPEAKVTEEDARAKVSPKLKVLSHATAIIPTGGQNEVFCHEFKCEAEDGRHYITYVNAENGRVERILILIESENG
ncbi:MAG: germination protein YpeB, partial [Oscillospiraceae bacterium]|nr:germination protein YpeB [Oscillospiraceae bacterium]